MNGLLHPSDASAPLTRLKWPSHHHLSPDPLTRDFRLYRIAAGIYRNGFCRILVMHPTDFGIDGSVAEFLMPLMRADVAVPPYPWNGFAAYEEYLLTHVGFSADCRYCQIGSVKGCTVLALPSLTCVAQSSSNEALEFRLRDLTMSGYGPLAGQRIQAAGVDGGGFALRTHDGWTCKRMFLRWPWECAFIVPPDQPLIAEQPFTGYTKVFEGKELIAIGFCPCGNHFVVANSYTLQVAWRA